MEHGEYHVGEVPVTRNGSGTIKKLPSPVTPVPNYSGCRSHGILRNCFQYNTPIAIVAPLVLKIELITVIEAYFASGLDDSQDLGLEAAII